MRSRGTVSRGANLAHNVFLSSPREPGSPTKQNVNKLIAGITGKPPARTPEKKISEDSMDFLDA